MDIKILGTGCCDKCSSLCKSAESAVTELGLNADIEKVTDIERIIEYGVMSTPALVVNGKIRSVGKVLSVDEVKTILKSI